MVILGGWSFLTSQVPLYQGGLICIRWASEIDTTLSLQTASDGAGMAPAREGGHGGRATAEHGGGGARRERTGGHRLIHERTLSAPVPVCTGPAEFANGRLTEPGRVATGAPREPDKFRTWVRLRLVNCQSLDAQRTSCLGCYSRA